MGLFEIVGLFGIVLVLIGFWHREVTTPEEHEQRDEDGEGHVRRFNDSEEGKEQQDKQLPPTYPSVSEQFAGMFDGASVSPFTGMRIGDSDPSVFY